MVTKEKSREYQKRYREKHREQIQERQRLYRLDNLEKVRAYERKYRHKHWGRILEYQRRYRAELLDRLSDVEIAERARKASEGNRRYREKNREKLRQRDREYQRKHKEERRLYDKLRRKQQRDWLRERRLITPLDGEIVRISGILKRPYPNPQRCELCGKKLRLKYHHWDDTKELVEKTTKYYSDQNPLFLRGLWVCQPCDLFIHRLTEFPFLAEKWFMLKRNVESEVYG